jgi:endonuclease/exonuclease/phosphatase family metal-dependent hydrolase
MQEIRQLRGNENLPYIITGDYNLEPYELAETDLLHGLDCIIIAPGDTQDGQAVHTSLHAKAARTIDYCVVDKRFGVLHSRSSRYPMGDP